MDNCSDADATPGKPAQHAVQYCLVFWKRAIAPMQVMSQRRAGQPAHLRLEAGIGHGLQDKRAARDRQRQACRRRHGGGWELGVDARHGITAVARRLRRQCKAVGALGGGCGDARDVTPVAGAPQYMPPRLQLCDSSSPGLSRGRRQPASNLLCKCADHALPRCRRPCGSPCARRFLAPPPIHTHAAPRLPPPPAAAHLPRPRCGS